MPDLQRARPFRTICHQQSQTPHSGQKTMQKSKKTAAFAGQSDFPESNAVLGAGNNPNTVDLAIWREPTGQPAIISKILLDDEDLRLLNETRCLFLHYRGHTHPPVAVFTETPFLTAEDVERELDEDIETVNCRITDEFMLDRVSRETTMPQAQRLNMNAGKDLFAGCERLQLRIVKNSAPELLNGMPPQ